MNAFGMFLVICVLIIFIGVGPLITLFAFNALFHLNIAYTFSNWFAAAWLSLFFVHGNIIGK